MRGAGTVALSPETLAARQRAADAAAAAAAKKATDAKDAQDAKDAKDRAAAAARSSRSSDRQAPTGGSPKAIARALMANYGWGDDQFSCLVTMWDHESGWNPNAENPGSGAYGIPQSLPGSKMAKYGSDWRTNPATQISWGLNYIKTRYSTPCGAWSFWQRGSWY
jgi:Transglycosylase SLT domain